MKLSRILASGLLATTMTSFGGIDGATAAEVPASPTGADNHATASDFRQCFSDCMHANQPLIPLDPPVVVLFCAIVCAVEALQN